MASFLERVVADSLISAVSGPLRAPSESTPRAVRERGLEEDLAARLESPERPGEVRRAPPEEPQPQAVEPTTDSRVREAASSPEPPAGATIRRVAADSEASTPAEAASGRGTGGALRVVPVSHPPDAPTEVGAVAGAVPASAGLPALVTGSDEPAPRRLRTLDGDSRLARDRADEFDDDGASSATGEPGGSAKTRPEGPEREAAVAPVDPRHAAARARTSIRATARPVPPPGLGSRSPTRNGGSETADTGGAPPSAEIHIGRIEVFVESPAEPERPSQSDATIRSRPLNASAAYLRRL